MSRDPAPLETDKDAATALTYAISHAYIMVRPDAHNRSVIWDVGRWTVRP